VAGDENTFNKVATDVMSELKVPIDDLCACVAEEQRKLPPRPASEKPAPPAKASSRPGEIQIPYDVHYTPEGYDQLATRVAESVQKDLTH
jgi:lysophospholipase L1-like esterase